MKRKNYLIVSFFCFLFFYLGYIVQHTEVSNHSETPNHSEISNDNIVNVESFQRKNSDSDDTLRIQRAIDYAKANKINTVLLGSKTYKTSSPLVLYSDMKLTGENKAATIILSTGDIPTIVSEGYFSVGKGSSSIQIENISIHPIGEGKKTKYAIEMVNTYNSSIKNCYIVESERTKNDVGGIRFSKDSTYQGNHFVNAVRECQLRNASIVMESTDSYIQSNEIWGHTRGFAIHLVKSSQFVTTNQIVGSSVHGGIWMEDTKDGSELQLIRITDNFFDGSYDRVDSGAGITGNKIKLSRISSNDFWRQMDEGIKLLNSHSTTITGNVFSNNNRRNAGKDDILLDKCFACVVSENTFKRENMDTNKGSAIKSINLTENKNLFSNNAIYSTQYYNPN